MKLIDYIKDGADYQARATLMTLQGIIGDGLVCSWDNDNGKYKAEINVNRWCNGREQGYVATLLLHVYLKPYQLNIAWYESKNSDNIDAVKWEQVLINPPTIDTANRKNITDNDHFSVPPFDYINMAKWIKNQFTLFYIIKTN